MEYHGTKKTQNNAKQLPTTQKKAKKILASRPN
jgi:hypothetical protein